MELELDEEICNVIARRQPAARDLRLLMAASKCVTNFEGAGDEARKVAKRLRRIHESDETGTINTTELTRSGELPLMILRRALDAFARMDAVAAAQIVRDDEAVDNSFRAFGRRLVMQMTEAPRTIPVGLEYMFIAKALSVSGTTLPISLSSLFMWSRAGMYAMYPLTGSTRKSWPTETERERPTFAKHSACYRCA
jgi:phosphate transport system protein